MHFHFDEQQIEFRDQFRAFAEKQCTAGDVREAWSSRLGWSPKRWSALAEMGVTGLTVPEEYGGMGLGQIDLVLLLEEAGRACMPEPLLETVALGAPLLATLSSERAEELRLDWLPRVAGGESVIAVGISSMRTLPAAQGAHLLLLEHRGAERVQLHAVPADEVEQVPQPSLDGGRRLSLVNWTPSSSTLLMEGEEAERAVETMCGRAATGVAALLIGTAGRMIDMASTYAKQRHQFGRPIGSFQAVKHHLASSLVRLEFARPLVYRAAWSLDAGSPRAFVHASMAKAQASEAALLAARTALQVHGAIGYTWEHDLHLWMKRAWALASAWGDAGFHRARVLEGFATTARSSS